MHCLEDYARWNFYTASCRSRNEMRLKLFSLASNLSSHIFWQQTRSKTKTECVLCRRECQLLIVCKFALRCNISNQEDVLWWSFTIAYRKMKLKRRRKNKTSPKSKFLRRWDVLSLRTPSGLGTGMDNRKDSYQSPMSASPLLPGGHRCAVVIQKPQRMIIAIPLFLVFTHLCFIFNYWSLVFLNIIIILSSLAKRKWM